MQAEQGLTLVEVMVGMAILAVVLIPMTGYLTNSLRMVNQTNLRSKALNLAQMKLEEVKSKEVANINSVVEDYGDLSEASNFKREVEIKELESGLKEVIITVWWADDNKSLQLKSIVGER
ncbi:MAG: type IV pilus modification PilV family protein [Bacillota bacterium]